MGTFRTQTTFSFFSSIFSIFSDFFETVPSGAKPEPTQALLDPAAFSRRWIRFAVDFGSVRCVDNLGDSESVAICALCPERCVDNLGDSESVAICALCKELGNRTGGDLDAFLTDSLNVIGLLLSP